MPYVTQADLAADIPPQFILQALDDDGDGAADPGAWDLIAQKVGNEIDAKIGGRYRVPMIPDTVKYPLTAGFPPVIAHAAQVLAAEKLFTRRQMSGAKNPLAEEVAAVRAQLTLIGKGELPLDPDDNRADPSASVITAPLQTVSLGSRLSI